MPLLPETKLGAYEILSGIGAGGMGEDYRARDRKLGRDVAIKVLPSSIAKDPERISRFEREARLLASLNHPNIATLHGLEDSDNAPHSSAFTWENAIQRSFSGGSTCRTPSWVAGKSRRGVKQEGLLVHQKELVERESSGDDVERRADAVEILRDFFLALTCARTRPGVTASDTIAEWSNPRAMPTSLGALQKALTTRLPARPSCAAGS
jgi:hypothetical protein